jgi:transglutaminase-like putative cysteine protease
MEHFLLDALAQVNRQSHHFAPAERFPREPGDEGANVAIMERPADPATLKSSGVVDLRVGCVVRVAPTAPLHAVMQVEPRLDAGSRILDETWVVEPSSPSRTYSDMYGNRCRRVDLPAGVTSIRYSARVEVPDVADVRNPDASEVPASAVPDDALIYTLPSHYCESDRLADVAWSLFGGIAPGHQRVQAICDWVHEHITFQTGSSTSLTSAVDVYELRAGVCRDFAHLAVAFCRAFSIPTRYCFGYLPDIDLAELPDEPMDFCAWIETYIGGRWYTFDPRLNTPRMGRVLIGRGRDALDVAMLTSYGALPLEAMRVIAEAFDEPSPETRPVVGTFEL